MQVLGVAGPLVAQLAHARLQANTSAQQQHQQHQQLPPPPCASPLLLPLSQGSVAVVTECVKALVAATSFAGTAQDTVDCQAQQAAAMQVRGQPCAAPGACSRRPERAAARPALWGKGAPRPWPRLWVLAG